ncbi:MAG: ABC transporter ATP-binding protein [Solirubrobacteraceae bacterium]
MSDSQVDAPPVLEVDSLGVVVRGRGGRGGRGILQDFSLKVGPADAVGIVGESGSGKSTLCRAISRTLPDALAVSGGSVRLHGVELLSSRASAVHRLRPGGVRMVFQHPQATLNPVMTIGRQIVEAIQAVRPVSRPQAVRDGSELLAEMGIPDAARRMNDYPHEFSGGQRQRIVIAIALAGEPALLLADEPTSALDVTTQAQILQMFARIRSERGTAIVLVSHNYAVVSQLCSKTVVLYAGRVVERGATADVLRAPVHPYTAGLIASLPSLERRYERLPVIPGEPQAVDTRRGGCPFIGRCPHREQACETAPMTLRALPGGSETACIRAGTGASSPGAPAVAGAVAETSRASR